MMMIDHLHIENFLAIETLQIGILKRINLIGGKNNVGKTALLEAIRIYVSNGNIGVINEILNSRQSFTVGNTDSYFSLFNRNIENMHPESKMRINDLFIEKQKSLNGKIHLNLDSENKNLDISPLHLNHPNSTTLSFFAKEPGVFIPFAPDYSTLEQLWEQVVLTPEEDEVIKIIQETVEPNLLRIVVGTSKVRVRLKDTREPVPLGTLGDGVQRILLIALSLVKAKNGYLLIDEIDMGLHYSILEKLWALIFKYAALWNIQVFATTHSQDALEAFSYIASKEETIDAQFIRLQKGRSIENEAILFGEEKLKDVVEMELEIR